MPVKSNSNEMRTKTLPGRQCWLCRRNFLSLGAYEAHKNGKNGGILHRRNLANADLVAKANAKLELLEWYDDLRYTWKQ